MWEFIRKGGVGRLLNIVALALGIVALVCYVNSAEDKSGMTETHLSALVLVPLIAALAAGAAAVAFNKNYLKLIAAVLWLCALLTWIFTQIGFIVNVLMGIDGNVFTPTYITAFVCIIACMLLSLFARRKTDGKPRNQSGECNKN